jgi:hypothetical protein
MPLKRAFELVERRRNLRAKPFLKTIPLPKSSNVRKESEPGEGCAVILPGFYPLTAGKSVVLFCPEESFAIMIAIKRSSYPTLEEVSTKDMILLGCPTQEDLYQKVAELDPNIRSRDIVTIIEGDFV